MKRFTGLIVPLLLLALALGLRQQDPLPVEMLRNFVFDTYQRVTPRPYDPDIPVRIGDIDEKSLDRFGQWPWSRAQLAKIVDRLRDLGAAAVALDIIFGEPDRTAPEAIAASLPAGTSFDAAREVIATLPDPDRILAESISTVPTVIPFAMLSSDPKRDHPLPLAKAGFAFAGDNPSDFIESKEYWVTSLPMLQEAAAGIASVNADPDSDGVVRRIPMFVRIPDPNPDNPTPFRPTLAVEALRIAQGQTTFQIRSSGASAELAFGERTGIAKVKVGQIIVPTSKNGGILLYDTGHLPDRYFSLADLMDDDFDPSIVAGRVIFIGSSVEGLRDYKPTPIAESMTGVEVHSQIAEQMLSGVYLQRPDWSFGFELVALGVFGLVLVVLAQRRAALFGFAVAIVAVTGSFAGSYYLFLHKGFLLDPLYPAGTAFLIFVATTLIGYIRTEREKAHVRGAFSRYLSPILVDQLSQFPERLTLGGELRELTVMFCDIRGFTKLSEGLDPHQLTRVINSFLTPMTRVIQNRQGTIDKYIGDCIMAFWNAPIDVAPHGRMAILAAYDMRVELAEINRRFAEETVKSGAKPIEIKIGIGLNSGICCVGNMGSEQRFDYSVLGDTVNVASRLEALSPAYGLDLVIGEETAATVADFALLEIDQVRVKGKQRPVCIYTGLGDEQTARSDTYLALKPQHDAMLAAYRGRDWDAAETALSLARAAAPDSIGAFYDVYAARIAEYRRLPPPADWDGVFEARSKAG